MPTKIYSTEDIHLTILKTNPLTLRIVATGLVNTSGWHSPQLIPYVYVAPPADGIYDFDFCAEPPSGIALNVLLPITAAFQWSPFPLELKGVRIHASSGSRESCLGDCKPVSLPVLESLSGGEEIPSPFSKDGRLGVPHFLTGIVVDEGIGWCRDGASHRLLHHGIHGEALVTRLKPNNKEAEDYLKRVSGTRQRVQVAGYMHQGIEPGCDYMLCYFAGPEMDANALAAALSR